ncbi:hypothetical protein FKM82_023912 [Ascaphus truei]
MKAKNGCWRIASCTAGPVKWHKTSPLILLPRLRIISLREIEILMSEMLCKRCQLFGELCYCTRPAQQRGIWRQMFLDPNALRHRTINVLKKRWTRYSSMKENPIAGKSGIAGWAPPVELNLTTSE